MYVILEKENVQSSTYLRRAATHTNQTSQLMILPLSMIGKMQESGSIKNFLKYIQLSKGLFCLFSQNTECVLPSFVLNSFQAEL